MLAEATTTKRAAVTTSGKRHSQSITKSRSQIRCQSQSVCQSHSVSQSHSGCSSSPFVVVGCFSPVQLHIDSIDSLTQSPPRKLAIVERKVSDSSSATAASRSSRGAGAGDMTSRGTARRSRRGSRAPSSTRKAATAPRATSPASTARSRRSRTWACNSLFTARRPSSGFFAYREAKKRTTSGLQASSTLAKPGCSEKALDSAARNPRTASSTS
mmetsp:Transcript_52516/g.98323  ORF Transcript_52516/g.98323 Transcript_52516/m.98323 type:complete len:214 (+) Transcript_52516:846-1487(+)